MLGHSNIWKYGYSSFKLACQRAKEMESRQLLNATFSIQLAFAEKKDFDKFLKEMKNGANL